MLIKYSGVWRNWQFFVQFPPVKIDLKKKYIKRENLKARGRLKEFEYLWVRHPSCNRRLLQDNEHAIVVLFWTQGWREGVGWSYYWLRDGLTQASSSWQPRSVPDPNRPEFLPENPSRGFPKRLQIPKIAFFWYKRKWIQRAVRILSYLRLNVAENQGWIFLECRPGEGKRVFHSPLTPSIQSRIRASEIMDVAWARRFRAKIGTWWKVTRFSFLFGGRNKFCGKCMVILLCRWSSTTFLIPCLITCHTVCHSLQHRLMHISFFFFLNT